MIIGTIEIPNFFVSANLTQREKDKILMKYEIKTEADKAENKSEVFRILAPKWNVTTSRIKEIYYCEINV